MEVGEESGRLYSYRGCTVATRMTPAFRWAAMRVILMFHLIVRDKVTRQCPQTTIFLKRKGEPKRYRTEVLPLTSLTNALPLGQTGSQAQASVAWKLERGPRAVSVTDLVQAS